MYKHWMMEAQLGPLQKCNAPWEKEITKHTYHYNNNAMMCRVEATWSDHWLTEGLKL
jgi:hypothetical protein